MEAWSGISMGFMGVVATLRVKFAQAITLGNSLGTIASKTLEPVLTSPLKIMIPKEYHKWVPVIIVYGCKFMGISIAWFIQRVIEAFYCAIRGAEIFAHGIIKYLARMGYVEQEKINENSQFFSTLYGFVAALGFLWQFNNGFSSLPFPLNILFLPITLVEWTLMYIVGVN